MKLLSVVGARPNFMKIAPFIRAIQDYTREKDAALQHVLVHTGQHYDDKMSRIFFNALDIAEADYNLGVGSGSHAQQVGQTMIAFEQVVRREKPDWVVVVGDVNATCACSITAKKEQVLLAHIEAGLRSRDMSMPEEVNRLVTDRLSDLLLAPDQHSVANLRQEGVPEARIKFVGNLMIDTLEACRPKAEAYDIGQIIQENRHPGVVSASIPDAFALMTMHRPSNVDTPEILARLVHYFCREVCQDIPMLWPLHPRTEANLKKFGLWETVAAAPNMTLLTPIGYLEMLRLNLAAAIMFTDSGGLQEECCVLNTPCITLRWNTERPVTLKEHGGASVLVGNAVEEIRMAYTKLRADQWAAARPELWDGCAARRALEAIIAATP